MNKLALITGGTKGIGLAVAHRMAGDGYDLIITSNEFEINEPIIEICKSFGKSINLIESDITHPESIDNIIEYLFYNNLKLDALVLNAAITYRADFEEMKIDDWKTTFDANIHYPVFLMQQILPYLNKKSSIVFTGSLMAIQPHSISLAYGVTKSAVHAIVKNMVKFLQPYEIRINCVAPGFVDTEWQKNKPAEIRKNIENKLASKRFCSPEELTDAYMFLINNNYVNGEIIVIDGAYSYK